MILPRRAQWPFLYEFSALTRSLVLLILQTHNFALHSADIVFVRHFVHRVDIIINIIHIINTHTPIRCTYAYLCVCMCVCAGGVGLRMCVCLCGCVLQGLGVCVCL